jgi:hypothetical protein
MAAPATQNPQIKSESKSSKKKKAKTASAETEASTASAATAEVTPSNAATESNNGDGGYESPYIKELYKWVFYESVWNWLTFKRNIRNVNKKIVGLQIHRPWASVLIAQSQTNASKVDNILAENPGKTLDELVAARKINADQKAQILKKPQLQASLTQLEEQIAQYKKFDQEYKARSQAEKAEFEKTFTEKASKELEEAVAAAKAEAETNALKEQKHNLLLLSQFLKLAAIRRGEDETAELEESKALEGLLAQVYAGDATAVASMLNLIQGSSDTITSVMGEHLSVTCKILFFLPFTYGWRLTYWKDADIKTASLAQIAANPIIESEIEQALEVPPVEAIEHPTQSDPTIINAGEHNSRSITCQESSAGNPMSLPSEPKMRNADSQVLQGLLRSMSLPQPAWQTATTTQPTNPTAFHKILVLAKEPQTLLLKPTGTTTMIYPPLRSGLRSLVMPMRRRLAWLLL